LDLRAQLQAHLGNAFALERELGGGGMSRVFVANEVRLSGSDIYVKQWDDQGFYQHNATNDNDTYQPKYIASALNGKPALRFEKLDQVLGSKMYLGDLSDHFPSGATLFVVGTINNIGRYTLFGNRRNFPNPGMEERPGLIGLAEGGSLFLDEIGDMGAEVQPLLLRVMERSREYMRLGDEAHLRRANVRFIASPPSRNGPCAAAGWRTLERYTKLPQPVLWFRVIAVLVERLGRLSDERMRELCAALEVPAPMVANWQSRI
jgi:hypothetical protein